MQVAVLMSTFNGEKYIGEQINSILYQEDVTVDLYVRDDGSTDKTGEILREYKDRIKAVWGDNVGVGASFMWLVYNVPMDYDYYAFSDQDDIWLSEKLLKAIKRIESVEGLNTPVLYGSNQVLISAQGEEIGVRFEHTPNISYKQIMCQNKITGCTMVWNRQLQTFLKEEKRRPSTKLLYNRMHDVWVAMAAATIGKIVYDDIGYIHYRQHENNVVGVKKANLLKQWMEKILNPSIRNGRSMLCKEIYQCFNDLIYDCDTKRDLECYGFYHESKESKNRLIHDHSLIQITGEHTFFFLVKVKLGLF